MYFIYNTRICLNLQIKIQKPLNEAAAQSERVC